MRGSPRSLAVFAATGLLAIGVAACGTQQLEFIWGSFELKQQPAADPAQGRRESRWPGPDRPDQEEGRHADRLLE